MAAFWSVAAAVSVGIATAVALRPGQLDDLHTVRQWLHYWLQSGRNPYEYFGAKLDYPPLAFLVLWPLALPSESTLAWWFIPSVILTTGAASWMLVRWMGECMYVDLTRPERVALIALMMAGSGLRLSIWHGQTVALALLFGATAMRYCRTRPYLAAAALALCSFKPHVAFGFALAILLTHGADVLLIAAAMVISLSLLFAATIGHSALALLIEYVDHLLTLYSGAERVRGLLSIRFVLDDLIGWYTLSTALYIVLAIASLGTVIWCSRRRRADAVTRAQVSVAAILWSTMFLPHQRYNVLLAAPALWLMMWPESGLIPNKRLQQILVGAYILFGVLDVPLLMRVTARLNPSWEDFYWYSYYLSPLRIVAVFLLVLFGLYRRPSAPHAAQVKP